MSMNIKQLFCNHLYKIGEEEYLYTTIRYIAGYEYSKHKTYAIHWKCIKCGKQMITKQVRPPDEGI